MSDSACKKNRQKQLFKCDLTRHYVITFRGSSFVDCVIVSVSVVSNSTMLMATTTRENK